MQFQLVLMCVCVCVCVWGEEEREERVSAAISQDNSFAGEHVCHRC